MPSEFSGRITADGSGEFPAASGRYHLYVAYFCPYAQRAINARLVKGLEDAITMDVLDCYKDDGTALVFNPRHEGSTLDTVNGKSTLEEIYKIKDPDYAGKVSIPILWDKETGKIVNNDSNEIAEILCTQMDEFATNKWNFYPVGDAKCDEMFDWIMTNIVGQVFGPFRVEGDDAKLAEHNKLFDSLAKLDDILTEKRYLMGDGVTKADLVLIPHAIRIDVGFSQFYIVEDKKISTHCPNLWAYLRDLLQNTPLGKGHKPEHIICSTMQSTFTNPTQKTVEQLAIDYDEPQDRASMKSESQEATGAKAEEKESAGPSSEKPAAKAKDSTDGKKEEKPKSSGCTLL